MTDEDDIVLDPFVGSGTTLVAAKLLNRKYIGIDISKEAVDLAEKRLEALVKTESILLKKGKKAYQNLTEEQMAILKSFNAVPVQRNSGIDGFLSDYINGRPVSVKIQKPDETLGEAVQKLYVASRKKKCEAMILIRTHMDVVSVMEFDAIPDGVIILDSYEMQIDQEIQHMQAGNTDFDYAQLSDEEAEEAREDLIPSKGFFILPSELFCNVCKRALDDGNLNETLERVFRHIEESAKGSESENSFAGLFDDFDVNSNKLGATVAKRNERLAKLLIGISNMNLGSVKDHDIDAFGDAYEYLMTMYASNAGKSGGEFFTPADVSELLTRIGTVGKKTTNKVYETTVA